MRRVFLACSLVLFAASGLRAQNFTTSSCENDNGGDKGWFGSRSGHACEVRRTTLPLTGGHLGVAGENGSIEVVGEDRRDIALEVRVTTQAPSDEEARALLHEIEIRTANDDIRAEGPKGGFHRNWSTSYKLRVPSRLAQTELHTTNGSINVTNLEGSLVAESSNGGVHATHITGELRATSTNGALSLQDLGGTVHAETTNGGVAISLDGDRWHGTGLFARSTNGGINIKAPDHFAAHLVADTTNGGISVGFPVTVEGKIGHHLDTQLNGGGSPVHLETTNGGISLDRL